MRDRVEHRAATRRGFTFAELLVACALVGILAAFAMPRLDQLRVRGDAAVYQVRGTLQLAQRLAVQHQWDVSVCFDVPNRRMLVVEDRNNNRTVDVGDQERTRWVPLDEGVRFVVPPSAVPGGVGNAALVLSRTHTVAGLPAITFHRSGSASAALEVYVAAATCAR
jgi:prepilin-type N-terminal cleavage/methylation domain-containing protein